MKEGGVAFVCCHAEIYGKGTEGENIGGVKGATEQHAGAVGKSDAYRAQGALIAE